MKHKKLSLDKVNVVRLNAIHTIFGGAKGQYDPTGVGVPNSTHCPDPTPSPFTNIDPATIPWVSENTNRPAPRSTFKCVPD